MYSERLHTDMETLSDRTVVVAEVVEPQQVPEGQEIQAGDTVPATPAPTMQVNITPSDGADDLIPKEKVVAFLDEIADGLRGERSDTSRYIDDFYDMIVNGGDATSSTKESFVNLVRAKREVTSEMVRLLDLMVRLKSKDRSLPPVVQQVNEYKMSAARPKKSSVMDRLRRKGNGQ